MHVSSFVWSYIQSILLSNNPLLIDLRLELEDIPEVTDAVDPVSYDPRQHSRHIEHHIILGPRTSLTMTFEAIWGRASPAPRSILLALMILHDGVPHDVIEVKSRIPADFRASGSGLEVSLSLIGLPAFHFHHGNLDNFMNSISETVSILINSNFHSEFFHLLPLLDNSLTIGTSAGIPITLRMAFSHGFQSLFSHYSDIERGSIDLGDKIGVNPKEKIEDKSLILNPKFSPLFPESETFSDSSFKCLWTIDFPLSFSYEMK
ncbi:hypothetical protein Anas_04578, partial [Armadillidium nasatum]